MGTSGAYQTEVTTYQLGDILYPRIHIMINDRLEHVTSPQMPLDPDDLLHLGTLLTMDVTRVSLPYWLRIPSDLLAYCPIYTSLRGDLSTQYCGDKDRTTLFTVCACRLLLTRWVFLSPSELFASLRLRCRFLGWALFDVLVLV